MVETSIQQEQMQEQQKRKEMSSLDVSAYSIQKEGSDGRKNEDKYFSDPKNGIFGVFDGVGGKANGSLASSKASELIQNNLATRKPGRESSQGAKERVKKVLLDAHNEVKLKVEGGSTTGSVLYMYETPEGQRRAVIGNVGDSRVYRLRNGQREHITLDDSWSTQGMSEDEARKIQKELANVKKDNDITDNLKFHFQNRNKISQSIGNQLNCTPRIYDIDVQEGDVFIICSDGVHDNLTDDEIQSIIVKSRDNGAKALCDEAFKRSKLGKEWCLRSKKDDITAIVVEIPKTTPRNQKQERSPIQPQEEKPKPLFTDEQGKEWFFMGFAEEGKPKISSFIGSGSDFSQHPIEIKIVNNPTADLLNHIETYISGRIKSCTNIPELTQFLNQIGGAYGSPDQNGNRKFYEQRYILEHIQRAQKARSKKEKEEILVRLTRHNGLREKVAEFLGLIEKPNPLRRFLNWLRRRE